ncbi:Gfo/Idh/MocA family protein [Rhodococcus opacus]|uniref:Gfo/Idh/MocA family protein n=1 Tax=Rhodococcus opacus TaxID=37919 RepID=UPI0029534095|nr:Gfo/Idh/MocA family oxidoreductase [Rhodococcus opacus]MDV7088343.1 Gfo/Idh/MocA family oxidoreductase [Rhodococcus opacus]
MGSPAASAHRIRSSIDIGTHAIDTVQHMVGPIRRVLSVTLRTAIDRRPIAGSDESAVVDTDDIALLTVELENGAVGQIRFNRIATGIPNSLGIEVHGSDGHARFDSIAAGEFHVHTTDGPAALAGPRRVFTALSARSPPLHGGQWISPESTGIAVPIHSDDGTEPAAAVRHDAVGAGAASDLPTALRTTARRISRAFHAENRHTNLRVILLMHQIRHPTDPI